MGKRNEKNKKYSAKFKLSVILDMRENKLSYRETCRKYNISEKRSQAWERIYLEEGAEGLTKERLKVEMYYGEFFSSADELISRLHEYIDYYNNKRISLKLKMSPVQYRTHSHIFY